MYDRNPDRRAQLWRTRRYPSERLGNPKPGAPRPGQVVARVSRAVKSLAARAHQTKHNSHNSLGFHVSTLRILLPRMWATVRVCYIWSGLSAAVRSERVGVTLFPCGSCIAYMYRGIRTNRRLRFYFSFFFPWTQSSDVSINRGVALKMTPSLKKKF